MMFQPSIIFDLIGQRFDTSSTVHLRSPSKDTPDRFNPAFSNNVHHPDLLSEQLVVV
jgi:hypothetical protein